MLDKAIIIQKANLLLAELRTTWDSVIYERNFKQCCFKFLEGLLSKTQIKQNQFLE